MEYGPAPERIAELFEEPIEPVAGKISLTDRPGLGLVLDQAAVASLRV